MRTDGYKYQDIVVFGWQALSLAVSFWWMRERRGKNLFREGYGLGMDRMAKELDGLNVCQDGSADTLTENESFWPVDLPKTGAACIVPFKSVWQHGCPPLSNRPLQRLRIPDFRQARQALLLWKRLSYPACKKKVISRWMLQKWNVLKEFYWRKKEDSI